MNPKSLRNQLSTALIASLAALGILGNILVFAYIRHLDLEEFDSELRNEWAELGAMTMIEPDGRLELEIHHFNWPSFRPSSDAKFYQLWDHEGATLLKSPSLLNRSLPLYDTEADEPVIEDVTLPDGRDGRGIWAVTTVKPEHPERETPGYFPGDPKNNVTIAYATSREDLDRILGLELLSSVLIGGMMTACSVLIVHWLTSRAFSEVSGLSAAMATIDMDSLASRVPASKLARELQPIAVQFNELLARLGKGVEREKRFNANIAHELRTPLTALLALHELAVEECKDGSLDDPGAYSEDALQLTQRMQRLIETLSSLHDAGMEAQALSCEMIPVPVLLDSTWEECESLARERAVTWKNDCPRGLTILSDDVLCHALFANLMDNAVTYSPRGSTISARAHRDDDDETVTVTLMNPPLDLDEADLPKLVEAFWQKDDSRTDSAHAGLGLSLVQSYTRLLGVRMRMSLTRERMFEVSLSFSTPKVES